MNIPSKVKEAAEIAYTRLSDVTNGLCCCPHKPEKVDKKYQLFTLVDASEYLYYCALIFDTPNDPSREDIKRIKKYTIKYYGCKWWDKLPAQVYNWAYQTFIDEEYK